MAARPHTLRPDNFTPPARTPWGGRKILDRYKRDLDLGDARDLTVCGEAWEVSVEPTFPSRLAATDALLGDAIADDPVAWLGASISERYHGQTPLLIKLLDAASNLSVQVHPPDDDPALSRDESGKYEVWYVLDTEPGAGLYLGFASGVERSDVERCLRAGGALDALLNFVPVAAGDAFVIDPGTVHAVGAGVTLVEPQWVLPGRRGVTYRYWDWNRRYDERGVESPSGEPRELHIERSLAVTRWDAPRGAEFVASCRSSVTPIQAGPMARTHITTHARFAVERWVGTGTLDVPPQATMLAIVCVCGAADLVTESGQASLRCGQSMVVPADSGAITVDSASGVDLVVTRSA